MVSCIQAPDKPSARMHRIRSENPYLGGAFLVLARLVVAGFGWAGTLLVARRLGSEDWGRFSLVFTIVATVAVVTDLQLSRIVLDLLHRGDSTVTSSYLGFRLVLASLGYMIALAASALLYGTKVAWPVAFAGSLLIVQGFSAAIHVLLQASLFVRPVAIAIVVGQGVQFVATVTLLATSHDTVAALVAPAVLNELVHLGLLVVTVGVRALPRPRFEPRRWLLWAREALLLAVGAAFFAIQARVGFIVVSKWKTLDEVGQYNIGLKFADLLAFVPSALLAPILSVLVAVAPTNRIAFRTCVRNVTAVLGLLAGLSVSVFVVCGTDVITWAYGNRFAESAGAAKLLIASQSLHFIATGFVVALVALGENRAYVTASAIGLCVTTILALTLVGQFSYTGAAAGVVVSELAVLALTWRALMRIDRGLRAVPHPVTLAFVASVAASVVGIASTTWLAMPWPVAGIVTGVVYVLLLAACGLRAHHIRELVAVPVLPSLGTPSGAAT